MPYGGNGRNQRTAGRVGGACLVIIDATTVFVAGGFFGRLISILSIRFQCTYNVIPKQFQNT